MQLMRNKYINLSLGLSKDSTHPLLPIKLDLSLTEPTALMANNGFLSPKTKIGRSDIESPLKFEKPELIDSSIFLTRSRRSSEFLDFFLEDLAKILLKMAEISLDLARSRQISAVFQNFLIGFLLFFVFPLLDYHHFSDLQTRPIWPTSIEAPTCPI